MHFIISNPLNLDLNKQYHQFFSVITNPSFRGKNFLKWKTWRGSVWLACKLVFVNGIWVLAVGLSKMQTSYTFNHHKNRCGWMDYTFWIVGTLCAERNNNKLNLVEYPFSEMALRCLMYFNLTLNCNYLSICTLPLIKTAVAPIDWGTICP